MLSWGARGRLGEEQPCRAWVAAALLGEGVAAVVLQQLLPVH